NDQLAFAEVIESLAKPGADQVLDLRFAKTAKDARELLENGEVVGYFQIDGEGNPELFVTVVNTLGEFDRINQTILKNLLDSFIHTRSSIESIIEKNPQLLMNPENRERLGSRESFTAEISVTANTSSSSVRYFYALLGFASIMAANVALIAVTRTQANLSALGARRMVGATSRLKTLAATLLACLFISYCCLVLAFCYMRFALGINFGRDLASIFGLFVAALMTTSLGALVGSIPRLGESAKAGIMTGLSTFAALFAGLYGTASQQLADDLTRSAPALQMANPAKQVTDMFYSLYYYDNFDHFFQTLGILLATAAILFLVAALLMRRQRYASL
ncbi:MAG: ABC transporter permease, partial [Eggerthellaceae bacterium]|nr:ABC transporter permease [Eggerthellaceae bacterium]